MAAGGFKEFVAGETLDEDEINDYLMQGMLVFAGTAARGSAIGTPVEGQFSFLKDSDTVEFYDGSDWVELSSGDPEVIDFLVIAGGGGGGGSLNSGGSRTGGGGGGGGFRTSFSVSGAMGTAEAGRLFTPADTFTVTVGSGGSGSNSAQGSNGIDSVFGSVTSSGGGGGGRYGQNGSAGGSGGGGGTSATLKTGGAGTAGQGRDGGDNYPGDNTAGPGGGAMEPGADGWTTGLAIGYPKGGAGLPSTITNTGTAYAGGGASSRDGGFGGGAQSGQSGTVNTGGGGAGSSNGANVGSGGSGIVVLRYLAERTLTIPGGLTSTTSTVGDFKITSFTSGTGTVEIN